jgi:hypothetical protein
MRVNGLHVARQAALLLESLAAYRAPVRLGGLGPRVRQQHVPLQPAFDNVRAVAVLAFERPLGAVQLNMLLMSVGVDEPLAADVTFVRLFSFDAVHSTQMRQQRSLAPADPLARATDALRPVR